MRVIVAVCLALSLGPPFAAVARAVLPVSTIQVTDDSLNQGGPRISGQSVVWWSETGAGGSDTREVFYRNSALPEDSNISNNEAPDFDPQISGNHVAWWGGVFQNFRSTITRSARA